jgi:elongation factor G
LRDQGIQPLLDAVVDYLPAPDEVPAPVAVRPASGEAVARPPDPAAPLLGLVFKTHTDRERGKDSFVRIYSGTLREGMSLVSPRVKGFERVSRLFRVHADKRRAIKEASAGDIVLVSGFKQVSTGDTVCEGEALQLEGMVFPEPVVSAALEARSAGDEDKIQSALAKLAGDDPTFTAKIDENTGQTVISGMGELHLEVLEQRLTREFGLRIRLGRPQVTYRETIRDPHDAEATYDRFIQGKQQFAGVKLHLTPLRRSQGFCFESRLSDGWLPAIMLAAVESALLSAKEGGILYGYPVADLKVELMEVQYSETSSTEFAFRVATQSAFRDGCRLAGPVLLEPVVSLEIVSPREFAGGVLSNLAARYGRVLRTDTREQVQIIRAEAPLSKMFGYATDLRSASQGRATYSMVFSHFEVVTDRETSPA